MMRSILCLAVLCSIFCNRSFSQNFVWATSMGGPGNQTSSSMTTDDSGNVFVTVLFRDSMDCDPGIGTAMVYGGVDYMAVTKQDSSGNLIWAKVIPGAWGQCIKADNAGNVYIGGGCTVGTDMDPGPAVYPIPGNHGFFILKLNANGDFIWAGGGSFFSYVNSIVLDDSLNVYLGGNYNGNMDFDFGPGVTSVSSGGSRAGFVAKVTSMGHLIWINNFGRDVLSIANDPNGNVLVNGYYTGTCDFDPGPGVYNLSNVNYTASFILKLGADGNFIWAGSFGPLSSYQNEYDMVTDYLGDIYITGSFSGAVDFDPGAGVHAEVANGYNDIFLLKLSQFGTFLWVNCFGSDSASSTGVSLSMDAYQNPFIAGVFGGTVDFDPGPGIINKIANVYGDVFVAKYNTNGILRWVDSFGTPKDDGVRGLNVADDGDILLSGYYYLFDLDADLGITDSILLNHGGGEVYLIKLMDSTANMIGIPHEDPISFTIYPNPCTDQIIINSDHEFTRIELYNSLGEMIETIRLNSINPIIQTSQLKPGIYFLRIEINDQRYTKKIIKQ